MTSGPWYGRYGMYGWDQGMDEIKSQPIPFHTFNTFNTFHGPVVVRALFELTQIKKIFNIDIKMTLCMDCGFCKH